MSIQPTATALKPWRSTPESSKPGSKRSSPTTRYPARWRCRPSLAEGGKVGMPLAETFWADTFGMVTDRFGTPWCVNGGPKKIGQF